MMRIAVLMTCHNRKETTLRCLRGLMPQLTAACDIFLVDDGSTDGTGDAVHQEFPTVRLLKGDGSLYWAKGMRKAWDAACEMNLPYQGYLWVNDDGDLDSCAVANVLAADDGHSVVVGEFVSPTTGEVTYGVRDELFTGNFVWVPQKVADQVGLICGAYAHAWADSDYAVRCRKAGVHIVSAGVVGRCGGHPNRPRLKGMSLRERWRSLRDPKGWNVRDLWLYRRRNWGLATAVASCAHLIIHVLKGER